jgi:POT family proton-dependent oligopeptide transporter
MTDQPLVAEVEEARVSGVKQSFLGHPIGLVPLFFTELWERFSYYGMRSILILYLTSTAGSGRLGFRCQTGIIDIWLVHDGCLPDGPAWRMDRRLFHRRPVGSVDWRDHHRLRHFSMVFHSTDLVFLGMALIAIGTGY